MCQLYGKVWVDAEVLNKKEHVSYTGRLENILANQSYGRKEETELTNSLPSMALLKVNSGRSAQGKM
jgi:hypothetical protein